MSSSIALTWEEFSRESQEFLKISRLLNDDWSWENENTEEMAKSYLKHTQKLTDSSSQEVIQIDYHVVYSVSYQVPMLYFQIFTSDGKMMHLENVWDTFRNNQTNKYSREEMLSVITQMDHPIFHRPFMCLHPCRTSEILAATPKSRNRILTFISVMGPFLHLNLDNRYGLHHD